MPDDLTRKVIAWATEVGSYAAKLPSRQAREDYLAERHDELATGAVAEGAKRLQSMDTVDRSTRPSPYVRQPSYPRTR